MKRDGINAKRQSRKENSSHVWWLRAIGMSQPPARESLSFMLLLGGALPSQGFTIIVRVMAHRNGMSNWKMTYDQRS